MQVSRRTKVVACMVLFVAAVVGVLIYRPVVYLLGLGNPLRATGRPVEVDTWRGRTEADLLRQLGPPTKVIQGYQRVGRKDTALPPGPCRTLRYDHPEGYLYVWLNDAGAGFICFESLWFSHGVQF